MVSDWLLNNYIELFGAVTGIIYVFLEIRQTIWLWPLGIITSGVYVWVFFTSKLYADMSLQSYYVIISVLGWYWWAVGKRGSSFAKASEDERRETKDPPSLKLRGTGDGEMAVKLEEESQGLKVTRIKVTLAFILVLVFIGLYTAMYLVLSHLTDSPVPGWDAFLTSLSIIATWMLARKIYEHWYLWIIVNFVSMILYTTRGLYPTVVLYFVYLVMSFAGLKAWKLSL
jgi:nicotinamide mononucleotide transporter